MFFIRATLFNITFYTITAIACIACLPALAFKRDGTFKVIKTYLAYVYAIEKYVLGLDYEIRGLEHLPKNGSFIVAAKHQSPYETLKLHRLFDDPAIVLKKELLDIPLWGKFLSRINPIAIDRSQKKEAMKQIIEGAQTVKKQGRVIVIFPQGTRVYPWETPENKPYRAGAARIQMETQMPIIPLALNTGLYWARKGWLKYPGKVIFEFKPALSNFETVQDGVEKIQQAVESATQKLEAEAIISYPYLQTALTHRQHVIEHKKQKKADATKA